MYAMLYTFYSILHVQYAKEYFLRYLQEKFGDTYSPKCPNASVHRYYESRRRLFNDKQPGRIPQVKYEMKPRRDFT